jgi:hypothetical protein
LPSARARAQKTPSSWRSLVEPAKARATSSNPRVVMAIASSNCAISQASLMRRSSESTAATSGSASCAPFSTSSSMWRVADAKALLRFRAA